MAAMAIQFNYLLAVYVAAMMLFYGVCIFFIAIANDLKRCLADLEQQSRKFIRLSESEQVRFKINGMIIDIVEFHSNVLQ